MRMTRSLHVILLLIAVIALLPQLVLAQSAIRVYVDGQPVNFDVPPAYTQGRVLVPLRGIFERLGATVDYDARTGHIVALRGAQSVELTVGSRQARVNNTPRLLDVPAYAVNGRTLVPLRFISESLGATVQWNDASRTVLIGSPGYAGAPVQVPPPQAAPSQISGRLMAVSTGQNPVIVVRSSDGQDHTIGVAPDTAILRYNADNNSGGSAPLGALQAGDQVTVIMNGANQASRITATYHVVAAGRIASVNAGTRTVVLANGQAYVVRPDAAITLNGQAADFGAIQNGRVARFSVIAGTNQAYEVRVATPTAAAPPASVGAPTITAPGNGATVGTTFTVQGTASPGARVQVTAQPKLLGQAAQASTTADAGGRWAVNMSVTSIPLVSFPFVISVVQIVNGTQSDAASIEVSVH